MKIEATRIIIYFRINRNPQWMCFICEKNIHVPENTSLQVYNNNPFTWHDSVPMRRSPRLWREIFYDVKCLTKLESAVVRNMDWRRIFFLRFNNFIMETLLAKESTWYELQQENEGDLLIFIINSREQEEPVSHLSFKSRSAANIAMWQLTGMKSTADQ